MKIIKYLILSATALIIFSSNIYAQDKRSTSLKKQIQQSAQDDILTVWVFFTDKGKDIKQKLEKAEAQLPQHALERRKKCFKGKSSLASFYDLPINKNYIQEVTKHIEKLRRTSNWLNALSAELRTSQIEKIEQLSFVKKIDIVKKGKINRKTAEFNFANAFNAPSFQEEKDHTLNYGASLTQLELMNVPAAHDSGYSGQGIVICVLDAGFNNLEHEAFTYMQENGKLLGQWDFVNNDGNVDDEGDMGNGDHGTATLSAIGGFYEGKLIGPAYNAQYVLAKTENSDSETQIEEDNWVAAVEWAENNYGPDITSTSLGYIDFDDGSIYDASELDGNTSVITIGADIAASLGILVINSAGNEGDGITTIGAPADGDSVLAVGAVNPDSTRTFFSSVGPTGDGRIKPDIMAQGSEVVVASSFSNNEYYPASGTSFSCPLAAGAAALLMEMRPNASNMDIFNTLKNTANNHETPNNEYGWGIINIMAASQALSVQTVSEDDIQIYPNPTSDKIKIRFNKMDESDIAIFNLSGQVVFSKKMQGQRQVTLNLTDFKRGVYILKINTNNHSLIKKIFVLR